MNQLNRKEFIQQIALIAGATMLPGSIFASEKRLKGSKMNIGLCTYLWGKDWDIPSLIQNCTSTGILGVELRVEHAHGVKNEMNALQRKEVKKQFSGSKVELVGIGTNEQYDWPDQKKLQNSIETTKRWLQLSKDIGASGVKVKPNAFHKEVPKEKTLEQIGKALNELGNTALDLGQQIRLEVHGEGTQELPNIKTIMDYVENKGTKVCWNCNDQDLIGQGLEHNFNMVKDKFGYICHVRELNIGNYPYQDLMNLFVKMDYKGWILLECRTNPTDKISALIEQREVWQRMIASAQLKLR